MRSPPPFFSVIIPTFNRPSVVLRALESVFKQTFSSFECLVIDDGSTLLPFSFPQQLRRDERFYYHYFPKNRGVAWARNQGLRLSRAAWITFLDSDDCYHPDKLGSHYAHIKQSPQFLLSQSEERWIRHGRFVNPPRVLIKQEGDLFLESLRRCVITPSSVVVHRSLFERYGKFDSRLPACEDYALWLRFTAKVKVALLPKQLLTRYGGNKDQLSVKYSALDRFRLRALFDFMHFTHNRLQQRAAAKMFLQKNFYLRSGARKRRRYVFWLFLFLWGQYVKHRFALPTVLSYSSKNS